MVRIQALVNGLDRHLTRVGGFTCILIANVKGGM